MDTTREPGRLEIFLTVHIGRLAGAMYEDYVNSLGLTDSERVLDFGAGSGNPAIYLAPILEKGGELVCMDVSAKWQREQSSRVTRIRSQGDVWEAVFVKA